MAGRTATVEIRPFTVEIPETELEALRTRVAATRWPDRRPSPISPRACSRRPFEELARYWASDYDWRSVEAKLNALPQFMTEIDGLDIHFIHVRLETRERAAAHHHARLARLGHRDAQRRRPAHRSGAHGGNAEDAFDLVIPSMPGYGFSGKPTSIGWDPDHIARAWVELMKRLGYTQFVAQGGDWGAIITDVMGAQAPRSCSASTPTCPAPFHPTFPRRWRRTCSGPATRGRTGLSAEESRAYEQLSFLFTKGIGYAVEMGLRPQTLYGLADSPVALAAWMLDHDARSYDDISQAFVDGQPVDGLTRDEVLDNITLTWLTNTGCRRLGSTGRTSSGSSTSRASPSRRP